MPLSILYRIRFQRQHLVRQYRLGTARALRGFPVCRVLSTTLVRPEPGNSTARPRKCLLRIGRIADLIEGAPRSQRFTSFSISLAECCTE